VTQDPIDLESVQIYHSGLADLPWYKVSEAVWSGSPVNVMHMVRQAFSRDSTAALPMIAALASDIRLMVRAAGLPRGMSDAEAGKHLSAHPFRVKVARQQLPRWSPTVLANAILSLAELDALVKGGLAGAGLDASARQHLVESAFVRIAAGRG
jgi:DNA polymerase III delta subunit